jgi:hypothetical protein
MLRFSAAAGAYVAFGTLLFSGTSHARHPVVFRRSLRRQAVWPPSVEPMVAVMVIAAEFSIGLIGLVALFVAGRAGLLAPALAASAVLYLLFTAYAALLVGRHGDVPCACSGRDEPVNVWTAVRAGLLAATSAGAWIAVGRMATVSGLALDANATVAAVAGLAIGVTVWNLPAALQRPNSSQSQRQDLPEPT